MPDDIEQGGTQESEQTPEVKTYTQEEMTEALAQTTEKVQKETVTASWSRFQSEADKRVAEATKHNQELATELQEFKRQQMENLSPEDRQHAMVEEVYRKMNEEPASAVVETQTQAEPSPDSGQDDQKARISKLAQKVGIDPDKIDWAEGSDPDEAIERFMRSIYNQPNTDQSNANEQEEQTPPDTSRAAGASNDITKINPTDLIARGYAGGNWRKRG